jgi:osmotically-inducible protein OsmY
MKRIKPRSSGCAALIVLASVGASLQVGETMAASSEPSVASSAAPASSSRSANRALRKRVYAAFAKDKSIEAGDIGVSATDGAVTLTGTVTDAAQIEKAGALASSAAGVQSVKNKLTVRRPFGQ